MRHSNVIRKFPKEFKTMEKLKQALLDEIPHFKQQGEAFLAGELSKMNFKKLSGGFGVYAHRSGKEFMIRLRIPSGIISKKQLQLVESFSDKYAVPIIHLTTRQAIQYHGISLEDVCHIMEEGIQHNIYTRGAGGNYPRNVAMSPLSGVDKEEIFDVMPYAMAANSYFLQRINTYHLPRKLKVAFSNSSSDTAHATIQDLGFVAIEKEGHPYFEIYIGGGLGRDPRVGVKLPFLVPAEEILYVLEAMIQLFRTEGDYENHQKARVRYIADRMGDDAFCQCFKRYYEISREKGGLDIALVTPKCNKKGIEKQFSHVAIQEQKQKGLYTYYFHPVGGELKQSILHRINEIIEPMDAVSGRLSMGEGIYLINLNGEEVEKLAEELDGENHLVGISSSRSCIGVPICQMGILESQKALRQLVAYFEERQNKGKVLPPLYISGCGNSCGVHQIGEIGLTGKKKKIDGVLKGVFEVYMGGSCKVGKSQLGQFIGEVCENQVGPCFYELAQKVEESGKDFNTYLQENKEAAKQIITRYSR